MPNPNDIKSQDDLNTCNDGERSVDVLVTALEKCEKLQKQLAEANTVILLCKKSLYVSRRHNEIFMYLY